MVVGVRAPYISYNKTDSIRFEQRAEHMYTISREGCRAERAEKKEKERLTKKKGNRKAKTSDIQKAYMHNERESAEIVGISGALDRVPSANQNRAIL